MKDKKRILCTFSFYDQRAMQDKLEEMARQGWMIEQPGNTFWTFRKIEPQELRFCVTYFPKASEFDPGPSTGELIKMDFCAADGWKLAARWGVMQIFYNENKDAVPIETDPVAQVANVDKAMGKNVLRSQAIMVFLAIYELAFQFSRFRRDPVDFLASPFYIYQLPLWGMILLASGYEIWYYLNWRKKARRAAEEDGIFLPVQSKMTVSYLLVAFAVLSVALCFGASEISFTFIIVWSTVTFLIYYLANRLKKWLKRKGAPRTLNLVLSLTSIFVLTLLFIVALVTLGIKGNVTFQKKHEPVGTYTYHDRVREIYDDPMPLEIEDMREIKGNWSKRADTDSTFLITRTEYTQRALLTEPQEVPDLNYTVVDVHMPALYELCKDGMFRDRDESDDKDVPEGYRQIYRDVDPEPWGAEEVYRIYQQNGGWRNYYLLCYEAKLVEIVFYWEPTAEEIAIAAERFG